MSIKLTTTSYLVLGLVARLQPCTPYDLKRTVANSIEYFWAFPHSQLYAEPGRLKRAGLLRESRERGGRRRRRFQLTEAGRAALADWLKEPTPTPTEIRDLGLLKLYFGEFAEAAAVAALAAEQQRLHSERLAAYTAICEARRNDTTPGYRLAMVEMGVLFERAAVAFWSTIASLPPDTSTASLSASLPAASASPFRETATESDTPAQLPEHLL